MKRVPGLVLMVLLAAGALAQEAPTPTLQQAEALERERIRQFRVVEQARFAAEEAQCYQRFAVNDCLQDVRRARRDVLADLRRQELSINDAQRKRRAAEQLLRADEKVSR
jgi:colicin import membrane protein